MDEPEEESPRRVTRADAFPLTPRPLFAAPSLPAPSGADAALKSFLVSVFIGTGSFVVLGTQIGTHTSGAQRSVNLERRQQRAQAQAELRVAEGAP